MMVRPKKGANRDYHSTNQSAIREDLMVFLQTSYLDLATPGYIYLLGDNEEWNSLDNLKIFEKVWMVRALNVLKGLINEGLASDPDRLRSGIVQILNRYIQACSAL